MNSFDSRSPSQPLVNPHLFAIGRSFEQIGADLFKSYEQIRPSYEQVGASCEQIGQSYEQVLNIATKNLMLIAVKFGSNWDFSAPPIGKNARVEV